VHAGILSQRTENRAAILTHQRSNSCPPAMSMHRAVRHLPSILRPFGKLRSSRAQSGDDRLRMSGESKGWVAQSRGTDAARQAST
jgi:hypothetical protein